MNELENTLQKILEKSIELAERTGEFVIGQAPEILQQFYLWHTISHILGVLLAGLIWFITIKIIGLWGESKEDNYHDNKIFGKWYDADDGGVVAYAILIIGAITSTIVFSISIYKLVFIIVAPKLYLLEYFL